MSIGRKVLPHEPPSSIDISREIFFITICAAERDRSPLLPTADALLESLCFNHTQGHWHLLLATVMPNHIHFLIRPSGEKSLLQLIGNWKQWTATNLGVQWQKNFFDHRLRNDESVKEKWHYILRNPERAGLVTDWREWPYVWTSNDLDRSEH